MLHHTLGHGFGPGKDHLGIPADRSALRSMDVAEARLIREEALEGTSEFIAEVLEDGLVDRIEQYLGRFLLERVEISFRLLLAAAIAHREHLDIPCPSRKVEIDDRDGAFRGACRPSQRIGRRTAEPPVLALMDKGCEVARV